MALNPSYVLFSWSSQKQRAYTINFSLLVENWFWSAYFGFPESVFLECQMAEKQHFANLCDLCTTVRALSAIMRGCAWSAFQHLCSFQLCQNGRVSLGLNHLFRLLVLMPSAIFHEQSSFLTFQALDEKVVRHMQQVTLKMDERVLACVIHVCTTVG